MIKNGFPREWIRTNPRPKIYGPLLKVTDMDWAAPKGTPIPKEGGKVMKTK